MRLVPLSYNLKSLFVRKSSTLLTVISVGATVAVLAGVLALRQGFATLFGEAGREDVVVFMRPGATSEGESAFSKDRARLLINRSNEIATDDAGLPIASAELFLAVRLRKLDGGETNVPIRGVQPMSFIIRGDDIRIAAGERFRPGTDEVIVGQKLTRRIEGCELGATIQLNTTPFRVVGIFENDGPFGSEIWGDVDRLSDALQRPAYSRVIAQLKSGVDMKEFAKRLEDDKEVPAKALSERAYLVGQTAALSGVLRGLGFFLAAIMGLAAVFTATNTMQAALAARAHEIGVLLSIGFRPLPVFLSFLFESLLLGLLGGAVGALMTLPLNGIETGTTNFQTFTEVAFAFRITPGLLATAIGFALVLGLLGGALPAWQAARLEPVEALRRR